jgi:hypothetical protein
MQHARQGLPLLALPLVFVAAASLPAFFANPAEACDVPVFRYVLERFGTDPQDFVIFHRGPLPMDAKQSVEAIQKLADDRQSPVAMRVRLIDLAVAAGKKPAKEPADANHEAAAYHGRPQRAGAARLDWTPPPDAPLPWLAVMPTGGELTAPLWSGPLRSVDLRALVDSPVRREVVQQLLHGESAVFLLLQSGKPEADAAAEKLLRTTLAEQEKSLVLPAQDGPSELLSKLPLKIAFSILRVGRNDSGERCLVQMLQNLSAQAGQTSGPLVFPIFGRGRVLTALCGESLRVESVQEICEFLCGECSCAIKGQVPGVDLLMTADWDSLLAASAIHADPPSVPGLGSLAIAAANATRQPSADATPATSAPITSADEPSTDTSHARGGPLFWSLLVILAGVGGLVGLGSLVVKTMRRDGDQ